MSAVWLLLPLYLVPVVSHSEVLLTILIFTYILGILAIGFNIVFGYAGQLTMFHGAAFGIGAYATYLILTKFGLPFWLALVPMFGGHPRPIAAGGVDLLQVQAARVLFCRRDAGLLRAGPAGRAQLEQRHEWDVGPSRARQAHRVAAGRRRSSRSTARRRGICSL